jgi:exonuclease VII small subunit
MNKNDKVIKLSKEITKYINDRFNSALEWYNSPKEPCDVCQETLDNAQKDLDCVLKETKEKFKLKDLPCIAQVSFDVNNCLVAKLIDKKLN